MQPISARGWTFDELLGKGERFKPATRVSCTSQGLNTRIHEYEDLGVPLVIENWHQESHWPEDIFNMDFCRQHFRDGKKKISARNVHTRLDQVMAFEDFVEKARAVPPFTEPNETERWYGKDVECPRQWEDWLRNECVLPNKLLPEGSSDILACRPRKNGRPDVETLMCYFGIADTYTPCHKDLCASSGQNLMCYTEKGGSSFWFMTKSSDCGKVTSYFHKLKHELDHETHVLSLSELANAPFDIYIVEQKLGDLVLVPPRSCHQVINFGGMTIKMSWSRMTLNGLTVALYHELPLYRRVCRPEIYQIKSTIYHTLRHYTQNLKNTAAQEVTSIQKSVLTNTLGTILRLYDHILIEEYSPYGESLISNTDSGRRGSSSRTRDITPSSDTESIQLAEDFHACDFCGADIFQSYFQCIGKASSRDGVEGYIVCPGCYVEGRTCACQEMAQMQRQSFDVLLAARWEALEVLKDTGHSMRPFKGFESPRDQKSYFSRTSGSSVFHAAMLLHQIRVNQRQLSRSCRMAGDSHPVPADWALNCKKCHAAKCFPHLLEGFRMHSMRALLLQEQDTSHILYHSRHIERFSEYDDSKEALLVAQEEGEVYPDFNVHMVYQSLTFQICQPVNNTHASLGWYDRLPPKPKNKRSTEADTERSDTPHSSTSGSQRSVKNHAYVELKPRAVGSNQLSSSPLSSASDELIFEDRFPHKEGSPSRRPLTTTGSRTATLERNKVSTLAPVPYSAKRPHDSHPEARASGTIFASVYPIGPPRKKKRQEIMPKPKPTRRDDEDIKPGTSNDFAAALGAAINQVAATATARKSNPNEHPRQKSQVAKRQPVGNGTNVPSISVTASSSTHPQLTTEGPIIVNVVDLQDMVVKTVERVVRQMAGEATSSSLMTQAAVSVMTGYAAASSFTNNNTQMRFPSVGHFAGVTPLVGGSMVRSGSHQGSPSQPSSSAANSGANLKNSHQQQSNNGSAQAPRTKPMERPDTTASPGRPPLPRAIREARGKQPTQVQRTNPSLPLGGKRPAMPRPSVGTVVEKKKRRLESDDDEFY